MSGYEPRWDIDADFGALGEDYVRDVLGGMRTGKVEVKHDRGLALETKNVYIEYECLRGGTYQPSGISTTQALMWAYVVGQFVALLPTASLRNIVAIARRERRWLKEERDGSHPTRGVAIPINYLVLWTLEIDRLREAA